MVHKAFDMEADRFGDQPFDLCFGLANGDTSWKVWHIGTEACGAAFDNDCVLFHFFNPACFRIADKVPTGTSSDKWPATVTVRNSGLRSF